MYLIFFSDFGNSEFLLCSPIEAELIRYASNSALAVKLGFANEISDLCTAMRADALVVYTERARTLASGRECSLQVKVGVVVTYQKILAP